MIPRIGKIFFSHGLEVMLERLRYLKQSTDLMPLLSKYSWYFSPN